METSPQRLILLQKIIIREERLLADRWTQNSVRFWELRRRPFSNFPLSTFNFFSRKYTLLCMTNDNNRYLGYFRLPIVMAGAAIVIIHWRRIINGKMRCKRQSRKNRKERIFLRHRTLLPLQRNHLNQLMTSVAFADKYSLFRCGSRKQRITTPIPMFRPKPESIIMWCNLW